MSPENDEPEIKREPATPEAIRYHAAACEVATDSPEEAAIVGAILYAHMAGGARVHAIIGRTRWILAEMMKVNVTPSLAKVKHFITLFDAELARIPAP